MNFKNIFWLVLLLSIIISIGIVTASDVNDTTTDIVAQNSEIDLIDSKGEDNLKISQETQISSQEDFRVIYVGENKTIDGDGSMDDPFNSIELACNNLSGEEKTQINIYNGTYYLNSDLKFNTSNLVINGIGNVIIKNLRNEPGAYASFGLTSSTGNFTFNNLIFDASNCNELSRLGEKPHFYVFNGYANLGEFYNCTFTGFSDATMFVNDFSKKFIYCNFMNTTSDIFFFYRFTNPDVIMQFDYCIFSCSYSHFCYDRVQLDENGKGPNIIFNNVWFGSNTLPPLLTIGAYDYRGYNTGFPFLFINGYAKFYVTENYLGNDLYEIVGKLIWDDGSCDGFDKFNPMLVQISSKTGNINKTAILENGTFKSIYKSNSRDNYLEIELDFEEVILEFKNDIQVVANPINYGDEQIITIILPQTTTNNITITVNNKTYEISSSLSIFNFTVPDELLAGNYQVDAKIVDVDNHLYGMNSTNWTISKINKNMIVTTPANACINDESITMNIILANDASGNITVFIGNKNLTKPCTGRDTEINISSLVSIGENIIKVVYSGNKKYSTQIKEEKLFVNRVYPNINITKPENPKMGEKINITITVPPQASGNITISAGDNELTIQDISTNNNVDITNLLIGGYNTISIRYSGDDWWDGQIKKETIYVSKINPIMKVNITRSTVKIDENFTINVTLPQNASGNLTIKIGEKNYIFNINDIISVSSSVSGNNTINITYNGDNYFNTCSALASIIVEKLNIPDENKKINVANGTSPLFTVTLSNDVTGNVTITINSKDYILKLTNGSASLKVLDLYPDNYNAKIVFSGDNKYNPFSENLIFNVPKPVLKANDINMLYTSGTTYSVQVKDSNGLVIGKSVTFTINGKKMNAITNKNGIATVKINLPPKSTKYIATAEYQGVKITNKIKVNSILIAKNVKVKKSAKTLKIKVSLKKINNKYVKGKKITLKFKSKKFTAKTNKKAVATFKIKKNILKKLKAGKKYKYQVIYLKDAVSKKIIVKR